VYALRDSAIFLSMCEKKAAHERRPESREETPKEASAAAMLHCNNDWGINFVQQERQISGLPLFFCQIACLRSLTFHCRREKGKPFHGTAPLHRPTHSSPPRRTNADWPGSSSLSLAGLISQSEECRKPHGTRGMRGSYWRGISMIRDVSMPWGLTKN
jgi:hypothetical protein